MDSIVSFKNSWNHRLVTWPIMILFSVFIIWASFSQIDESVKGSGVVIPSGQTKIIQHLEGGIIKDIYVKEGDNVKKGDPLFRLSQAFFLSDKKERL
jgi:HlyD family secretion protein/adhesin transport system membrane fusion protein